MRQIDRAILKAAIWVAREFFLYEALDPSICLAKQGKVIQSADLASHPLLPQGVLRTCNLTHQPCGVGGSFHGLHLRNCTLCSLSTHNPLPRRDEQATLLYSSPFLPGSSSAKSTNQTPAI